MSGGIRVDGMTDLRHDLTVLGADLADLPAMEEIASRGAALAQSFAPRRTGTLARSIQPSTSENRAAVTATAPYAGMINWGSKRRHIRPSLFMQRADKALDAEAVTAIETAIDRLVSSKGLS